MPLRQDGVSLIELMIALVIAALLTLGMIQIFVGSKVAYQVQENLSRIQENGRFSLQYLERNVRLAGYMGCGSDIERVPQKFDAVTDVGLVVDPTTAAYPYDSRFRNHLVRHGETAPAKYRFQRPIEGFDANAPPNDEAPAIGAATDWTPALPDGIDAVKGSDVLILRIFGEESTPVTGGFSVNGTFKVADPAFVKARSIYGIENCGATPTYGYSEVFQAATADASGNITAPLNAVNVLQVPGSGGLTWNNGIGFSGPVGHVINASVHEARYLAIYVGLRENPETHELLPSLFVQHLGPDGVGTVSEELADGVENMQLVFGRDTSSPRDDNIDDMLTADEVVNGATTPEAQDAAWQRVISVRIGLLVRGQESNSGTSHDAAYTVAGTSVNPQNDHRIRQVYETTVTLRNRIFNT